MTMLPPTHPGGSTSSPPRQLVVLTIPDRLEPVCRVIGVLRRRGVPVESLTMGPAEPRGHRHLTVAIRLSDTVTLIRQLERLVDVVAVRLVAEAPALERELAVMRVLPSAGARNEVVGLAVRAGARISSHDAGGIALELTDTRERIERFVESMRPLGLREVVRTGTVALPGNGESKRMPASELSNETIHHSPETSYRWQADGGGDDDL